MDYDLGRVQLPIPANVRSLFGDEVLLVHGRPVLQVPPFIRYGHAWIEIGGMFCYDAERREVFPRALYYAAGQIKPDVECYRYTAEDLRRWVTRRGHWGPWEGIEAEGLDDDAS